MEVAPLASVRESVERSLFRPKARDLTQWPTLIVLSSPLRSITVL